MAPLGPRAGGRMVSINWASVNRADPQADSAARKDRFFPFPNAESADTGERNIAILMSERTKRSMEAIASA
jgi:hypothetical protein